MCYKSIYDALNIEIQKFQSTVWNVTIVEHHFHRKIKYFYNLRTRRIGKRDIKAVA